MTEKLRKYLTGLTGTAEGRIRLAVFLLVFVMNCLTVPTLDDLGYKMNSGLLDILKREYIQYMTWTGRTTAHLLARTFLALPKIIFNLCNAWCFAHLCTLIRNHASGTKSGDRPILYLLGVLAVFLAAPLFGQTCLWETGSCNYLWTTVIVLQFLQNYRFYETDDSSRHSWILMFLAGIPAGWTNENTGGALILMIMYFVFLMHRRKNVQKWMLSGLAGAVLGFVMLLKAPGNSVRALDFFSTNGKAYNLIHDIYGALEVMQIEQTALWLLLGAGIALCALRKAGREVLMHSLAYAFAGAAAVCAIILSPVPVLFDRSMFGATIFLIIGVLICAEELMEEAVWKKVLTGLMGALLVYSGFSYIRSLADLGYVRYQYHARESYVSSQKEQGNLNPTVPLIYNEFMTPYNAMFGLGDLSEYRSLWANELYAEAHGLESVQSTSLEHWNRIYRNGDPMLMNITDFRTYLETAAQGNRVLLVCSSGVNTEAYSEYLTEFAKYGLKPAVPSGDIYICAVIESGQVLDQVSGSEPGDLDGNIGETYYYLSSQTDPEFSDILVNGIEYTNDNKGITIAVYDRDSGRITDSVTWNTESDQGGIRYYIEK